MGLVTERTVLFVRTTVILMTARTVLSWSMPVAVLLLMVSLLLTALLFDNIVVGLRVVFCRGVVVFLVDVAVAGGVVVVAFEVVVVTARGSVVVVIGGDDFDVVVCVVVVVCIDADGEVVDCVVVVDGVVVVVVVVFVVVDEYALVDTDSDTWRVPSPLTATQTNWYLRTVVSGSRKLTDTFRFDGD